MSKAPEVLTYLTEAAETAAGAAALRVGDPVELRQASSGRDVEAWLPLGRRLGRLPPAEREAVRGVFGATPLRGHIAALVPRPLHGGGARIHIRLTAI